MRSSIVAKVIAAGLLLLPSAYAQACQANLTGVWFINGFSQDAFSGESENIWCKVRFNGNGVVLAGASSCSGRQKNQTGRVNITGGRLRVNNLCKVRGTIRLAEGGILNVDDGRLGDGVINIVGVGEAPDRWHVVLNGLKRPAL